MRRARPSLSRRITFAFILGNAVTMLVLLLALYPFALAEDGEPIGPDLAVLAASQDLVRTAGGRLAVRQGGTTSELAARHPDMWFSVRAGTDRISYGSVPLGASQAFGTFPSGVREARFSNFGYAGPRGEALITRVDTPAGAAIVAGGGIVSSSISYREFLIYNNSIDLWWIIPITALLALGGALLVTPIMLRGVRPALSAAANIDPADLAKRLPEHEVVKELAPLVRAFNDALDRLAAAAEQRKRFIADVAHELRTPVAVLNMQVEELPAGGRRAQMQRTVYRLSHLVGQMLDAERLTLKGRRRVSVDLVELARACMADVAPLAVTHGYEMSFSAEVDSIVIDADPDAVSRAISNLLGNAVAHGGGAGTITVSLSADGKMDVSDQGPGVPIEARERIFEPFHRERWDRDGCGLGLHLVREIMRAHGGDAAMVSSPEGAMFRLQFAPERKLARQ